MFMHQYAANAAIQALKPDILLGIQASMFLYQALQALHHDILFNMHNTAANAASSWYSSYNSLRIVNLLGIQAPMSYLQAYQLFKA